MFKKNRTKICLKKMSAVMNRLHKGSLVFLKNNKPTARTVFFTLSVFILFNLFLSIGGFDRFVYAVGDYLTSDGLKSSVTSADITIGTNVVASNIEPIGANVGTVAGGTNFAINNHVSGGGFEPAIFRELHRVETTGVDNGYRWFSWTADGGLDIWDTRKTGFLNGAVIRFYRLVDSAGKTIPYASGMGDATGADHVVFLGEKNIPMPSTGLPGGGFVAEKDGLKRIYINQPLDLQFGDYAFIFLKKEFIDNSVIADRILQYKSKDTERRRVKHPDPIPAEFTAENPGETCLMIMATSSGSRSVQQYTYHPADSTSTADALWYSQLRPGAKYRVELWMRQDGLSNSGRVYFGFSGEYAIANQTNPWIVTDKWQKFTYDFTGPNYPSSSDIILHEIKFTAPGTLYMDNWAIYRYDEKHNFKPFVPHENSLNPIIASFPETGKKPSVRFYGLQYGNSSIESMLGEFSDSTYYVNDGGIRNGERATIAQSMRWAYATGNSPENRVVPWLTLSEEYTEIEFKALIEYLGVPYNPAIDTPTSKPYAYKRYVQRNGNGAPWTNEFREILFEYGNETWHQGAGGYGWHGFGKPGAVHTGGKEYGLFAKYMFDEQLKSMPEWSANNLDSKIKFVYGANYSANKTGSYGELAVQQGGDVSYLGHANYVGPKWETGDTNKTSFNDYGVQSSLIGLFGSKTKDTIDNAAAVLADLKANKIANYRLVAYEGGPSGYWMNPNQPEIDEYYGKSLAMGVAALDTWLYSSQAGYGYQNYLGFSSGKWWTSHTMPEQGGFRAHPGWLALTMRNRYAVGSEMVSAVVNSAPTYNSGVTNIPLISSYAIRNTNGDYSVFVLSRKLDGLHDGIDFGDGYTPVTIHLPAELKAESIMLHKLASPNGLPADPRTNNIENEKIAIVSQNIDMANFSSNFVINEKTGGGSKGIPPGTAYLYVFKTASNNSVGEPLSDTTNDPNTSVSSSTLETANICSDIVYSTWSICINDKQTRTVIKSVPAGCTGGVRLLEQSCAMNSLATTTIIAATTTATTIASTTANKDVLNTVIIKIDDDKDGLSNDLEIAIGSNPYKADSDNDGYSDMQELLASYNLTGTGRINLDSIFSSKHRGKIFIQTESKGAAWYINPGNNNRYFLGRPKDAFDIMRKFSLGVKHRFIADNQGKAYVIKYRGKILLDVEDKGKAYYIDVRDGLAYYLGSPANAFEVIRKRGVGIKNSDIIKIKVGLIQ